MTKHLIPQGNKSFRSLSKGYFPACVIVGSFRDYLSTLENKDVFIVASKSAFEPHRGFFMEQFTSSKEAIFFPAGEPTADNLAAALLALRERASVQTIIALGGGSVLDLAKALKQQSGAALIAIPTTPSSGSETTPFALLLNHEGAKMILNDPSLIPDVAVLDYSLLKEILRDVLGPMLFDIVAHAVESTYSRFHNPLQSAYAGEALSLLETLPETYEDKDWSSLQTAGFLAGAAQGISGTGLCHAIAHVIGPMAKLPHSAAIAYFLRGTVELSCGRTDVSAVLQQAGMPRERILNLLDTLAQRFDIPDNKIIIEGFSMEKAIAAIRKDPNALTHPLRPSDEELSSLIAAHITNG